MAGAAHVAQQRLFGLCQFLLLAFGIEHLVAERQQGEQQDGQQCGDGQGHGQLHQGEAGGGRAARNAPHGRTSGCGPAEPRESAHSSAGSAPNAMGISSPPLTLPLRMSSYSCFSFSYWALRSS